MARSIPFAPTDSIALTRISASYADGGIEWYRPTDLRRLEGGLAAANSGNFEVVGLRTEATEILIHAQRGRGPGEFERIGQIRAHGGDLWVSDPTLKRIIRFSIDGRVREHFEAPSIAITGGFDALAGQVYAVNGRSATHYLMRIDENDAKDAAPVPSQYEEPLQEMLNQVVAARGSLHVLDNSIGVLRRYPIPDALPTHTLKLPEEWHTEVATLREQAADELAPNQVAFFPFATILSVSEGEQILILTNRSSGPAGILVDGDTYRHVSLVMSSAERAASQLKGAVLRSDTLWTLDDAGISRYILDVASPEEIIRKRLK